MNVVFLGLSITSSWGNGHATTYRGLVRELAARGHAITFLERDVLWYRDNRDQPNPAGCTTVLYESLDELKREHAERVRDADVVVVGSYVPEGVAVGEWATQTARGLVAFYDIDTPVTLAKLARGDHEYLTPALVARYGLYLSFTGGPTLRRIEQEFGSPMARALYCSVDPALYFPATHGDPAPGYTLGYMGTYSDDRQPTLDRLLVEPARAWPEGRFIVAGPQYPDAVEERWPPNVERVTHLAPRDHRGFYCAQDFTLNVTRADMIAAGWSPSVRLFEAAACATPIISDWWEGLDEILTPGREILVAHTAADVLRALREMPEDARRAMGEAARARVLAAHTAAHRAAEFEAYAREALAAA